ncbi:MAG: hypothetical protein VW547_11105 [Alphaproteobacteria bacterium]|jgi:hypothetical protein
MDESVDSMESVDLAALRWRDAGALLARLDPELFESMVRAAEVTAVAVATAQKQNIG